MADAQAYHTSVHEARTALTTAMKEATALLPAAVLTHHWIATHSSPAAWASTEAWFLALTQSDPAVSRIICDLKLMAEALACLDAVALALELGPVGSLKLAKVRRTP